MRSKASTIIKARPPRTPPIIAVRERSVVSSPSEWNTDRKRSTHLLRELKNLNPNYSRLGSHHLMHLQDSCAMVEHRDISFKSIARRSRCLCQRDARSIAEARIERTRKTQDPSPRTRIVVSITLIARRSGVDQGVGCRS